MITLVLSDIHLTHRFEKKKFKYLKRIILSADRIVINGDFWDGYFTDFERFITSKWSRLFPLLKSKKTIYLYGNHDRKEWCSEKVSLFSEKQSEALDIKIGKNIFRIEHGNKIVPAPDDKYPWVRNKRIRLLARLTILLLGKILLKPVGQRYRRRFNRKIKIWWKNAGFDSQVLVTGHSHVAELNLERKYINSGFIQHGLAHYLKIADNKIELINEKYY